MPIYNYLCDDCKNDFEVLAKNHNDSIVNCTSCVSSRIKKVYKAFDFNLKKEKHAFCDTGSCPGGSCGL